MKYLDFRQTFDVVTKVYDSIENFQRKLELAKGYKAMKEKIVWFDEERQKILEKYADPKTRKVPEANRAKSDEEWGRLIQTEVTVDKAFKFTKKEIEESKITGSQLVVIFEDFMK